MSDPRRRHQLEDSVEHAEARAQDRNHNNIGRDPPAVGQAHRRVDRHVRRGEVPERFGGQQDADPSGRAPERFRRRSLVAQRHERILNQRVIDDVKAHDCMAAMWGRLR